MKKFIYRDTSNRQTEGQGIEPSDLINTSAGVSDAGKPVKTNSLGKIDPSLIDFTADIESAKRLEAEFIASETISALKLVRVISSGQLALGDNLTFDGSRIIGISLNAGTVGQGIRVLLFGKLDDPSFTFPINDVLFLSTFGNLTNVPPASNISLEVAQSLGVGSIFIRIDRPIIL
jgi:hypothetical protein